MCVLESSPLIFWAIDSFTVQIGQARKRWIVLKFPWLTTIKQFQRSLGLANFYRIYIEKYAYVTKNVTRLYYSKSIKVGSATSQASFSL